MTEEIKKPELTPEEIYRRNITTMPARQFKNHLVRKARSTEGRPLDGAYTIVLREVYSNTERQVIDDHGKTMRTELEKTFGKLSPGLR